MIVCTMPGCQTAAGCLCGVKNKEYDTGRDHALTEVTDLLYTAAKVYSERSDLERSPAAKLQMLGCALAVLELTGKVEALRRRA